MQAKPDTHIPSETNRNWTNQNT